MSLLLAALGIVGLGYLEANPPGPARQCSAGRFFLLRLAEATLREWIYGPELRQPYAHKLFRFLLKVCAITRTPNER